MQQPQDTDQLEEVRRFMPLGLALLGAGALEAAEPAVGHRGPLVGDHEADLLPIAGGLGHLRGALPAAGLHPGAGRLIDGPGHGSGGPGAVYSRAMAFILTYMCLGNLYTEHVQRT